jgi:hypothetical protein
VDDVLEQERQRISSLNRVDALAHQIERFGGLGHGQHDAEVLSVDLGIAQVLAVPGDVHLLEELVEQTEIG